MPQTIHLSDGSTKTGCVLCVRNITGIAEERGFRLYWIQPDDQRYLMPALGLVTSIPFRRADDAKWFGKRVLKEDKVFLLTETGLRLMK